ncbi:3-dehydroquinate synthase family protein [Candidatus Carsonella ruddii]|uniref:3-dehydroquinate synthase n=1 Tax=Candidatus Carsonella ruddii CE isolate Thao2000 TaxID=1202536 RepID=J7GS11_CARRU|nr:3-dehydroquinate synthase [Candidatus Carsonella ruddii]AFP83502.1 3-dehydroquinate synthase [Candidatus Carsonella ruddii CE isolate Thao2000]
MKLIKSKIKNIVNIFITNKFIDINNIIKKKKILIIDYNIFNNFFFLIKKFIKKFILIIIPYNELSKNINILKIIWKILIIKKINKNNIILSISGGVLNDIIGFISSSYLRGIIYLLFPSTLLSQIDSSIGGKNAINFFSKNSIGSIYFSLMIYINYSIIFYMKKNEFKDGYSEIIKYSLINCKKLFFYLFKKFLLKKILIRSCYIKTKIITQDYKENNIRVILNFGHTYGHCIENNIINNISHGEAVSFGIYFALFISNFYFYFKKKKILKILFLLKKFNFLKNKVKFNFNMINKFILDKKFKNKINFIVIKNIGNCIQKIIKKNIILNLLKIFYEI